MEAKKSASASGRTRHRGGGGGGGGRSGRGGKKKAMARIEGGDGGNSGRKRIVCGEAAAAAAVEAGGAELEKKKEELVDIEFVALAKAVTASEDDETRRAVAESVGRAYGPDGLGILTVSGVPDVERLRQRLLPLSSKLAGLRKDRLVLLEDADSSYSVGWSHGKEILEGGKPDLFKGSFYANPLVNRPTEDVELMRAHPSYCRPNLWPTEDIPELEDALMELGTLVVHVGEMVGVLCDAYVSSRGVQGARSLGKIIRESKATKARLLHYFPPSADSDAKGESEEGDEPSNWCGWHLDHGSLTGLVAGMFMDGDTQVSSPDATAGLYIKDRRGVTTKVSFGASQLAFQIGQASQVHSGGALVATPHCVKGASGTAATGVARNSFAVFMQPLWDEPMDLPDGSVDPGVAQWADGVSFGEFTKRTLSNYYSSS